jgi:hypothetical protein
MDGRRDTCGEGASGHRFLCACDSVSTATPRKCSQGAMAAFVDGQCCGQCGRVNVLQLYLRCHRCRGVRGSGCFRDAPTEPCISTCAGCGTVPRVGRRLQPFRTISCPSLPPSFTFVVVVSSQVLCSSCRLRFMPCPWCVMPIEHVTILRRAVEDVRNVTVMQPRLGTVA